MPKATTYSEYKIVADKAREKTFAKLGIEEGSRAQALFDNYFRSSNNFQAAIFAGKYHDIQYTAAVTEVNDRQLFADLHAMAGSKDPQSIATAMTVRQAMNDYNYEMRGPGMVRQMLRDPYVSEEGEFKPSGVLGMVGGALLGVGLMAKSATLGSMGWLKKTALVAFTAVMGGAVMPYVMSLFSRKDKADEATVPTPDQPASPSDRVPASAASPAPAVEPAVPALLGEAPAATPPSAEIPEQVKAEGRAAVRGGNTAFNAPTAPMSYTQGGIGAVPMVPPGDHYMGIGAGNQPTVPLGLTRASPSSVVNDYPNRFPTMQMPINQPNPYYGMQANGRFPFSDPQLSNNYGGLLQGVYNNPVPGSIPGVVGELPNVTSGFKFNEEKVMPGYDSAFPLQHNADMVNQQNGPAGAPRGRRPRGGGRGSE